ncbi:MAG: hypothetical protein DHS20C11_12890 [Lysobacteraceae bacterium]|nr:MAG: hypothetical protein DHS20C11_12890 [Xanthomonadaceae bacterium]
MNRIGVISLLVLMLISITAVAQTAKVYKWVDEDGVTHYTTTPPPENADYERLKLRTGGGSAQAANNTAVVDEAVSDEAAAEEPEETYLERRKREAEERRAKARERELLAEECGKAQRALTFYTTHTRIDEPNADGTNIRRITEEERQAHIRTAEGRVAQYCNP